MSDPFDPTSNPNFPPFSSSPSEEEEEISFEFDIQMVPEGRYNARVVAVSKAISNAGNNMVVWEFVITDPAYSGFPLTSWTAMTKAAFWKLEEVCGALGIPIGLTESGLTGGKFVPSQAINCTCIIEIVHSEYNGRVSESIKRVFPPPEGPGTRYKSPTDL